MAVAEAFMEPNMLMADNVLHVKSAATPSHVGWHRDSTSWKYEEPWSVEDRRAWDAIRGCETPFAKFKIFYFVENVDETTSPFSVVPGSHGGMLRRCRSTRNSRTCPAMSKLWARRADALLWNG